MTTTNQTFNADGTFTAPATLLRGSISFTCTGAPGGGRSSGGQDNGGPGAIVTGGITIAASGTLTIYVADYHRGGAAGSTGSEGTGGAGGGSSAIVQSGTLMAEAGGGGGAGTILNSGGGGGQPGLGMGDPPTGQSPNGANGATAGTGVGNGASGTSGGVAGSTNGGAGGASGGAAGGGGGGGGVAGGGGGNGLTTDGPLIGSGGGGGGSSMFAAGVSGGTINYGTSSSTAAAVVITYTFADAPFAPTLISPANGSYAEMNTPSPVLSFTYRPGTDSGAISTFALRRQVASGAAALTVAAGSSGVAVSTFAGAGTLNVTGTQTNWDTSGLIVVPTSTGTAILSYTGKGAGTFTGVSLVSGTGTLVTTANAVTRTAGYEYYNATTGFWNNAAAVWNAVTVSGFTVASPNTFSIGTGKWTDGATYNWSIATAEANYPNINRGVFAPDFTVIATQQPVITLTAPPATSQTTVPNVTWTFSGSTQINYRVIYYTQAQAAIAGFIPGVSPSTYDSGVVASAATSFATPGVAGLTNGVAYVIYVQVQETGGVPSGWVSTTTTISLDGPAAPLLTAVASNDVITGAPFITLVGTSIENQVSALDSSFEGGKGSWIGTGNCAGTGALTSVTTQALDGLSSLLLSSTAAGTMSAGTAVGIGGYAVTALASYNAMAWVRAATAGRTCTVGISWYTSGGTFISTTTGTGVADVTTGWTQLTVAGTAPATAAFASVGVTVAATGAANEQHYVDQVALFAGNPTSAPPWSIGGNFGEPNATMEFQSSDDGGVTWADLRFGAAQPYVAAQSTCLDYEAPPVVNPQTNLMPYLDSTGRGQGGWAAANGTALASLTAPFLTIPGSIVATSNGGGILTARDGLFSPTGAAPTVPVTAGTQYTALAWVMAQATPRSSQVGIIWYDQFGNLISSSNGLAVVTTTTGWTALTFTGSAPASAAYAQVRVVINGPPVNGEIHYIDNVGVFANPSGGSIVWTPGPGTGAVQAYQRKYRARGVNTANPALPLPGNWSNVALAPIPPSSNAHWFISDPTNQASAVQFDLGSDWKPRIKEVATRFFPIGRPYGIKSTDGMKGVGGQIEMIVTNQVAWQNLMNLLSLTRTLLLQSPYAQWYITAEGDSYGDVLLSTVGRTDFAQMKHLLTYMAAAKP